jgi:hypothetical protein
VPDGHGLSGFSCLQPCHDFSVALGEARACAMRLAPLAQLGETQP